MIAAATKSATRSLLLEKPKVSRLRAASAGRHRSRPTNPASSKASASTRASCYAKNRPYVLCVMTTYLKSEAEGERAIEEMSRVSYEYFSRLGAQGLGNTDGQVRQ